jgi:hypothetical protein
MRGAKEAVKNKALEAPPGPAVLPPSPGYPLPGCSSAEPDSVSPDPFTLSIPRLQNQKSSKSIDQRRVRCRPYTRCEAVNSLWDSATISRREDWPAPPNCAARGLVE